jgi:hypothetical protein
MLNHLPGIPGIYNICQANTFRFSRRKVISASSYSTSSSVLIRSFLFKLLGSTRTSLSSAPFFFPSVGWSVGCWLDVEAPYAPYLANGGWGEAFVGGLGVNDLNDVLPPCVFAIFAACSWAAFSPNRPPCVNVAFSHAKESHWSVLMVITP